MSKPKKPADPDEAPYMIEGAASFVPIPTTQTYYLTLYYVDGNKITGAACVGSPGYWMYHGALNKDLESAISDAVALRMNTDHKAVRVLKLELPDMDLEPSP